MSFVQHIFNKESPNQIQIVDIKKLIENETEESLHLDFEEIPKKGVQFDALARHISGFLNTSGGIVVFGLSEKKKKGQNIPYKITWTTFKKETLENNLYQKIDPWCEDLQIHPIQNPDDTTQRIFIIFVPKSKNPPHMANHTYYMRLNFQTQPMGHEQVSTIFRQHHLQKYDLINTVYGPIFHELVSYMNKEKIQKWKIVKYEQIRRERLFLLAQDTELYLELEDFYDRVSKWNKAVDLAPFRLAKIINDLASEFFNKPLPPPSGHSAIKLDIKSESTNQLPYIDEAVLNKKDPIDFWKDDYPLDRILDVKICLEHYAVMAGNVTTMLVNKGKFREFMKKLKKEVDKDELIRYIWKEFDELQSAIETLLEELESKMQ